MPVSELSKLPAITQTGANTFGCLINGVAFVPQNQSILQGPKLQCNYIFTDGGYYFTILTSNKNTNGLITQIQVVTDSLTISEGQTLTLKQLSPGHASASYALITSNGDLNSYVTTNNTISGQLIITKLDPTNQIVSGTFFFTGINNVGDVIQITDGRFDMLYTR
jgi:hypothetical protein